VDKPEVAESYLILSDEDESTLKIHETALNYFYGGKIITTSSTEKIIEAIKSFGRPELIFVDYNLLLKEEGKLHTFLESSGMHTPLVAALNFQHDPAFLQKYPVSSLLTKPVSVETLTNLVKHITNAPVSSPSHIPVSIQTLLEFTNGEFDYYLKLSGKNYIKVINQGDSFSLQDAEKLLAKGIKEVHIKASDSHELLKICEKKLHSKLMAVSSLPREEGVLLSIGALEQMEAISKALGWTQEVLESTQKAVTTAISTLSKDTKLSTTLKKRFSDPSSSYAKHVGLQTFLSCGFSSYLEWPESSQIKLAMASLLHDLAVDDIFYEDIESWNKKAQDLKDKSEEVVKYRLHPFQAAKIAQSLENLPPDVDQIIMQHHEVGNSSGFPRSLSANRISSLSSLFIMMEDLIGFFGKGEHIETSLKDYLMWGESFYVSGHFKKIFEIVKIKINLGI
jgi:response regulator RpfG family c-di-GMP phosphodiesterase